MDSFAKQQGIDVNNGCVSTVPVDLCVITLAKFKFNVYAFSLPKIDLNIHPNFWLKMNNLRL
jgi:hypothetical protein